MVGVVMDKKISLLHHFSLTELLRYNLYSCLDARGNSWQLRTHCGCKSLFFYNTLVLPRLVLSIQRSLLLKFVRWISKMLPSVLVKQSLRKLNLYTLGWSQITCHTCVWTLYISSHCLLTGLVSFSLF